MNDTMRRLVTIWSNMTTNNRVLLILVVAGFIVAATVTVRWANQAAYTTLYTNLEPKEAGEIVDQLTSLGVDYRLSSGGTAILVPERSVQSTRLKMAAEGYPRGGTVGYEIFDKSNLGMTDFLQRVNFRRALEGEIAKSIMSLSEVSAARVHLVIPETRLFARDQKPPTASVVVKLNRTLTRGQVAGIEHLVAASVEGLTTDHIAIVDYRGTLLSDRSDGSEDARLSSSQLELRKNVEHYLENKAQSMLDGTLGQGKSVVRVIADLNFDKVETNSESWDPDQTAIRSEEISNAGNGTFNEENSDQNATVTKYEISKSVERVVSAFGNIKRLSVAVIVDGTYHAPPSAGGNTAPVYQPRSGDELQKIGALVQTAVGFDSTRSDKIEVVNMAFDAGGLEETQADLDTVTVMTYVYDIGKKLFYLALAVVAFFYLRRVFSRLGDAIRTAAPMRRTAPAANNGDGPMGDDAQGTAQRLRLADAFASRAAGKPDEVAKIIKTMMLE